MCDRFDNDNDNDNDKIRYFYDAMYERNVFFNKCNVNDTIIVKAICFLIFFFLIK